MINLKIIAGIAAFIFLTKKPAAAAKPGNTGVVGAMVKSSASPCDGCPGAGTEDFFKQGGIGSMP